MSVLYILVCGSPAARRVGVLVELAQADGWDVCVVTTPDGRKFVDAEGLAAQTGHPVRSGYKHPDEPDLLPPPDALVVAPATVNTDQQVGSRHCRHARSRPAGRGLRQGPAHRRRAVHQPRDGRASRVPRVGGPATRVGRHSPVRPGCGCVARCGRRRPGLGPDPVAGEPRPATSTLMLRRPMPPLVASAVMTTDRPGDLAPGSPRTSSVAEVVAAIEARYPPTTAEDWDRVGLVVGEPSARVQHILLAVDCVPETVDEAIAVGAQMMVVHHPLLLRGVHSVATTRTRAWSCIG